MIILGIDPGTARLGWAVVEKNKSTIAARVYGCITTQPKTPAFRLAIIYRALQTLIKIHKPDALAIEELFFAKNVKTALSVSEARGVVLLAAAQANIPITSYTPLVIKQTITGNGQAQKEQMQKMVQILLKLKNIPKPDDTADALAVALTHAFTKNFI
ncbi:crossover junction endodeoxyribonuclease RuvC [Candidatus Gottesmanbacteria bacterium]|nr:crossover junction endodeoxyribonuclease RuvC [Candidatus Gottesmanbacteria bacterium]